MTKQYSPGDLILVHVPPGFADAVNDLVWTPALVVGNDDDAGYHVLVEGIVWWTPELFTMRIK